MRAESSPPAHPDVPQDPFWQWLVMWPILATVYCIAGLLCADISAQVANVSWMLYIPAGISLTASLLWGRKVWVGVFVGELAMALLSHQSIPVSLAMACGNGADAFLAGWWFHDRPKRRIEFDRLADIISLLAAEMLVLQPMSALVGVGAIAFSQALPSAVLPATIGAWYTANLYAQFVMAPVVVVWVQGITLPEKKSLRIELLIFILVTCVVGMMGPGRFATVHLPLQVTFILIFPLLVWAAVRFPSAIAVTAGSVLGLFAVDAALAGMGPFAPLALGERMLYLNVFMAVTIASALFLAAATGDARRFEAEQARLIEELRATSAQVERLKELVTFCAWTGRVRWRDEWVSVEEFLRERYGVTITHGISEGALSRMLSEAEFEKTHGGRDSG